MISFDDYEKICKDFNKEETIEEKSSLNELKNSQKNKKNDENTYNLTPRYKILVKSNFV